MTVSSQSIQSSHHFATFSHSIIADSDQHGLINYIEIKANCCYLNNLSVK
jgi:hypothetical protein